MNTFISRAFKLNSDFSSKKVLDTIFDSIPFHQKPLELKECAPVNVFTGMTD